MTSTLFCESESESEIEIESESESESESVHCKFLDYSPRTFVKPLERV